MATKRLEVRLDDETQEVLSDLATERQASISEIVRFALRRLHEEDQRERRHRAVKAICEMEIEDVPEPEELSRQLAEAHDPGIP